MRSRRAGLAGTLVLVSLLALVGCGSDENNNVASTDATVPPQTSSTTTAPTTSPTGTTTDASTPTSTATSTTTSTSASVSTPATTEPCPIVSGTDPVIVNFPNTLSSLVGRDIRTGRHTCFERVVLELQGEGTMPGYRVQYVEDPVRLSPSDQEVGIAGDATLVLSAGSWMTTMEGGGYQGPDQIVPTNVEHIAELRLIENFEGMFQWAIGLDAERPFTVVTLSDPPRIVVDIAT